MNNDDLRKLALEVLRPVSAEADPVGLKSQREAMLARGILKLLDRPSMSCTNCEEHNAELAEELDSVKRWQVADERESLAWNSWLEAIGIADELVDINIAGERFPQERVDPERARFEKWWQNNKFFQ